MMPFFATRSLELGRRRIRPQVERLESREMLTAGFAIHLTTQHVDIGLAYENGEWNLHVHNDTDDVEAAPDEAMLFVGPGVGDNPVNRPAGAQWNFLGVGAGQPVWIAPQAQDPDRIFLGIGAEEADPDDFAAYFESDSRVNASGKWIKLTLKGVRRVDIAGNPVAGAGAFSVYQTDAFGNPTVWMTTSDGISNSDAFWVQAGSHAHVNWAFTQPGFYEVDFEASARLNDANQTLTTSDVVTYRFAVNNFLTNEHVDLAANFSGGTWQLGIQDKDAGLNHDPAGSLQYAGPSARISRPAGAQWNFLGPAAGADVWILPQSQNPNVLYLGASSEQTNPGTFSSYLETDPRVNNTAAWIKLSLKAVRGPGHVSAYQTDQFGTPTVWMSTADGGITSADALFLIPGAHAHFNWAFSARGFYEVDLEASAFLGPNQTNPSVSATRTFYFQVEEPGWIRFDTDHFEVDENAGLATITVVRIGDDGPVQVNYATSLQPGDTASVADFTAVSGTLTFANGQTTRTFQVPIVNDMLVEGPETLTLILSNPTGGARLGGIATATLTIRDDEVPPNPPPVAVDDGPYTVAEDGILTVPAAQGVLANDTNTPATDVLTASVVTGVPVQQGTLNLQANGAFTFTPAPNFHGQVQFTYKVNDGFADSNVATVALVVTPVADTPSVTNAVTEENVQTTSGLVISRNLADGVEVTHFQITNIVGGLLFQNDGVTPIVNGDFITAAQGNAGLRFTPALNSIAPGSFQVRAATSASVAGLGGNAVTATITISPVANTPSITNATTLEDTQTTSGLVVTRHPADGDEVTHYKILGVTGGTLFQSNGLTMIPIGSFITAGQGAAGLRFTPSPNSFGVATVTVRAATSASDAGLGGDPVVATINVLPVADTPSITNATTNEDAMSSTGLVLTPNPVDGPEVTHFKVTLITGGTLFLSDGVTRIVTGSFLTREEGAAGLRFLPGPDSTAMGMVSVRASTSASDTGVGGDPATAFITVNPINDPPTITVPGPQTTRAEQPLVFSTAGGNPIRVADVDAGLNPIQVTLTATNGVVRLGGTAGLIFQTGTGLGDPEMTFTGSLVAVNAALDGLTLTPQTGFTGTAMLNVQANDLGNTGAGGALTALAMVAVNVTARATSTSSSLPEVVLSLVRLGRGRVRILRFQLATPAQQTLRLGVRIPLKRTPGVRRTRFLTGLVVVLPGQSSAEFVFRLRGNPPVQPRRTATVELSSETFNVLRNLGF